MKILILGAAAGGGFPQWNDNTEASQRCRAGDPMAPPASQSSIAVSVNDDQWVLFNASPDIRQQINDNPAMHPRHGRRDTPIASVILTNGDVDHIAGLLTLRESQPFAVYGTDRVMDVINTNAIFNALNPKFVDRRLINLNQSFEPADKQGHSTGLCVEPFAVPGRVALYNEDETQQNFGSVDEDTIGLKISDTQTDQSFFYIPGCAAMPEDLKQRLQGSALLLFDGTLWVNEEMLNQQVGIKTGARMGHMSMTGDTGSMAALADCSITRKIFVHINNTNPVLLKDSPERQQVLDQGWQVAYDGMEIEL